VPFTGTNDATEQPERTLNRVKEWLDRF